MFGKISEGELEVLQLKERGIIKDDFDLAVLGIRLLMTKDNILDNISDEDKKIVKIAKKEIYSHPHKDGITDVYAFLNYFED